MTDAAALDAEFGMQTPEFASRRTLVLRRFLRRPSAVAALIVLLALFIGCYAVPSLLPYSYSDLDFNALLQPPNLDTGWAPTHLARICWLRPCGACRSQC